MAFVFAMKNWYWLRELSPAHAWAQHRKLNRLPSRMVIVQQLDLDGKEVVLASPQQADAPRVQAWADARVKVGWNDGLWNGEQIGYIKWKDALRLGEKIWNGEQRQRRRPAGACRPVHEVVHKTS
jgi:hypothetical protein